MKTIVYFILTFCCLGLFLNCEQSDQVDIVDNKNDTLESPTDKYFTDLNGTLIATTMYLVSWDECYYNLDIDKDSTIDLSITVYKYFSSMHGLDNYIQIAPRNGYQLYYTNWVDTTWYYDRTLKERINKYNKVLIPKMFNIGDTIKSDGNCTSDSMMFVSYSRPGIAQREFLSDIIRSIWLSRAYKYIALSKKTENEIKLAWIKLKVESYTRIVLNSCKYSEKTDELIIKMQ